MNADHVSAIQGEGLGGGEVRWMDGDDGRLTGGDVVLNSSDVAECELDGVSEGMAMKAWYGCPPAN